jgi:hypothetical protein
MIDEPPLDMHAPNSGEVMDIDVELDPPEISPENLPRVCNHSSLSRLTVRQHAKIPKGIQKTGVRDVLDKMGRIPEVSQKRWSPLARIFPIRLEAMF